MRSHVIYEVETSGFRANQHEYRDHHCYLDLSADEITSIGTISSIIIYRLSDTNIGSTVLHLG